MVFRTFLLKYGEIGIKGKNRGQFEDALVAQVRYALEKVEGEFEVSKEQGRIYVNALGTEDSFDAEEVIQALQRVFGLVGICQVLKMPVSDPECIAENAVSFMAQTYHMTPAPLQQILSEGFHGAERGSGRSRSVRLPLDEGGCTPPRGDGVC